MALAAPKRPPRPRAPRPAPAAAPAAAPAPVPPRGGGASTREVGPSRPSAAPAPGSIPADQRQRITHGLRPAASSVAWMHPTAPWSPQTRLGLSAFTCTTCHPTSPSPSQGTRVSGPLACCLYRPTCWQPAGATYRVSWPGAARRHGHVPVRGRCRPLSRCHSCRIRTGSRRFRWLRGLATGGRLRCHCCHRCAAAWWAIGPAPVACAHSGQLRVQGCTGAALGASQEHHSLTRPSCGVAR